MTSRSILVSLGVLAAACSGCQLVVLRDPSTGRAPFEVEGGDPAGNARRQVPLALCEDYRQDFRRQRRSLDEVRRDLALLEAARVDTLRVSIGWDAVEPQRDEYDFAFWDQVVELATEAGVTLIPSVANTPAWNSDGAPESFWKTPPRDVGEFAELMQRLAERYRGRIRSWEIWNEPDSEDHWLGTSADYATLVAAGADGVRAGDPEARVVLGGLAGGGDFLRELFDEHGVADRVDVVSLHAYPETWGPTPLESLPAHIGEVKAIVERHGGRQSLWVESGYSTFVPGAGSSVDEPARSEHTPEFQAVMLVRTLALLLAEPAVSLIAWYELKDARPGDDVVADAQDRHLGVSFADHRPKPALDALAFMRELFGAGVRSADRELRVEPVSPDTSAIVRAFITASGELVLVAWLPTHGAAASRPIIDLERRGDRPGETLRISFPWRASGPAARRDATGQDQGELPVRDRDTDSELELELRGGDVQVLSIPIDAEPQR